MPNSFSSPGNGSMLFHPHHDQIVTGSNQLQVVAPDVDEFHWLLLPVVTNGTQEEEQSEMERLM